MRVVPPNHHLWSTGLLEHVQHLGLENVVDGFDRDGCTGLRHGKDVDDRDLSLQLVYARPRALQVQVSCQSAERTV